MFHLWIYFYIYLYMLVVGKVLLLAQETVKPIEYYLFIFW